MGRVMAQFILVHETNLAQKISVFALIFALHGLMIYWAARPVNLPFSNPKTNTTQAIVIIPVPLPLKKIAHEPVKKPSITQPKVQTAVEKTPVLPPSPKAISVDKPMVQEKTEPVIETKTPIVLAVNEMPVVAKSEISPEPEIIPPRSDAAHLNNPAPSYPSMSRRLGEQGRVVLEVYILANGTVGEAKIKESSGFFRLDNAALQAVKKWRYQPARRGQQAIDFWYVQPLSFSLNP